MLISDPRWGRWSSVLIYASKYLMVLTRYRQSEYDNTCGALTCSLRSQQLRYARCRCSTTLSRFAASLSSAPTTEICVVYTTLRFINVYEVHTPLSDPHAQLIRQSTDSTPGIVSRRVVHYIATRGRRRQPRALGAVVCVYLRRRIFGIYSKNVRSTPNSLEETTNGYESRYTGT